MNKLFLLSSILLITIACENSESGQNSSILKTEIESPCDLLSEREIKEALDIPADAETKIEEKNITYPMCKYQWEAAGFTYTMELPGANKRETSVDHPAEMYITMVKEVSKEQYETSVSFYDDAENQDGIGDIATYSPKKRQVTFLSGSYLIHVYLRTSADEKVNKEQVIKMAKLVSKKM